MKISVIVPMYNAERYITGCVDALLRQTIGDLEVIVVNDCSTDDSMALCQRRYGADPRVVLIQQPRNMGPGQARNAGMKAARGEYMVFIDADDGLLPEALKEMYDVAAATDADVVHTGGFLVPYQTPVPDDLSTLKRSQLIKSYWDRGSCRDDLRMMEADMKTRLDNWMRHHYHWNAIAKLFRTAFIREQGVTFPDLPLSEDYCFVFHCMLRAKRFAILHRCYYIYRICMDSLSRGSKTPAFLAKTLRALFGVSRPMERAMEGIPFFDEHPEYRDKIIDHSLSVLDDFYVTPALQGLGRAAAEADGTVREAFRSHFGYNARCAANLFYNYHDTLPRTEDVMDRINQSDYWENALASGALHLLEEDA